MDKNNIIRFRLYEKKLRTILKEMDNPEIFLRLAKENRIDGTTISLYHQFYDLLRKYFDLTGNVIEVGYGAFPIMSTLISMEQQRLGMGSVTAYERDNSGLDVDALEGMQLFGEFNAQEKSIKTCDLLVGISPCTGMGTMFDVARDNRIDYFIAICDCYHNVYHMVYENAKSKLDSDSELIFDESISPNSPVLIKRKKH